MNKPNPNMAVVRDGFIKGGNHPDDVSDLYFLYRWFKNISYMKSAIQIWDEGDREIANLLDVGQRIRQEITVPLPAEATADAEQARAAKLAALENEMHAIDARLTLLENRFSATLGEGSRAISKTLMAATIITTCALGVLSLTVAIMITKAIVRLDKKKTEFVSFASHQLRTPLTAIKWSAEALVAKDTDNLTHGQQRFVDKLREGSQRMSVLIDDLLRMSSLDLGTYHLAKQDVNISNILKTAANDLQKKIASKNLTLDIRIDPTIPAFKTDGQLLAMICQNLLSNSVKYTHDHGRIEVAAEAKKGHLYIRVSDNGIGIPLSQQRQIFDKLFRADNALKHSFNDGTGLGLYIAKAMAERLGGKIWFDSTENVGTNFYVKIPLSS